MLAVSRVLCIVCLCHFNVVEFSVSWLFVDNWIYTLSIVLGYDGLFVFLSPNPKEIDFSIKPNYLNRAGKGF